MTIAREQAREAYAAEFDRMGPAWRNTAGSIRAGFENLWVRPAIDALERVIASLPDDPDET